MKSTLYHSMRLSAVVLALSLAAACDDEGSGPSQTGNLASTTNAVVDSVVAGFLEENEGVKSLTGPLGGLIAGITGQPSIVPGDLSAVGRDVWLGEPAALFQRSMLELGRARGSRTVYTANIPSNLLGVTCIWDAAQQRYVADPNDDMMAPPNGIRFRLYELDSATQLPAEPLVDIGRVDIIDLGVDPSFDVSVSSDIGGVTVLDYGVTGTVDVSTFTLGMSGFLSDGTGQLDFDWSASGTGTTSTFSMSISAASLDMGFDQMVDPNGVVTTTITVQNLSTGNELEIILGVDTSGLETGGPLIVTPESGIFFNGEEVADFRAQNQTIELVPSPNSSLDEQDLAALLQTLNLFSDLFVAMDSLFIFAVSASGDTVS